MTRVYKKVQQIIIKTVERKSYQSYNCSFYNNVLNFGFILFFKIFIHGEKQFYDYSLNNNAF